MNRQQFNSRNNVGKVLTLQKSGSTTSFDPAINFSSGTRRVSWKLTNGSETIRIAGNSITYTGFTSDPNIRTIEVYNISFKNMSNFNLSNDNLYGNLNMDTVPNLGGGFDVQSNSNLTGITFSPSSNNFTNFRVNNCNLTGLLDLSPLSGMGGTFQIYSNPNLTGITHSPSSNSINVYDAYSCNLTGKLIVPFSVTNIFRIDSNPNLTEIIHSPSNGNFSLYQAYSCNLTGLLDLSPLSGMGGTFQIYSNPNLTGVTFSPSSNSFINFRVNNCNLTGNLNLPFSGLGGTVYIQLNPNLTGITHSPSSNNITSYRVNSCNLNGTHDISMLIKMGSSTLTGVTAGLGNIILHTNSGLTNVILPPSDQFFRNILNVESLGAFSMYSCNLGYVDFRPLSGSTLASGSTVGNPRISLRDNNMSTTDVNHILVDFSGNASYNPSGWSNVNLNIGGTNSDPDSSSGGYDGLGAIAFLTGSPYNWTITY